MSLGGVTNNLVPAVLDATKQSSLTVPSYVDANQSNAVGGKGGVGNTMMPVQQTYAAPNVYYVGASPARVGNFDNTGRIVDSTLLQQQAMLNRAPVSYQPLLTPDNYQNFYKAPAPGGKGGNNLVVPDYRPQAQVFRQDAANAVASGGGGGGESSANGWAGYGPSDTSYTGYSDALASGYNANGQYSVAPVESRGTDTGFGGYGGINGTGASMSAADADVAFGAANYGGGGGYGTEGGVSGVGVGSSDGVNGMDAASDAASAAASGGDGGGGGGGKIVCTAMNHAYGFGSFRNSIWLAYSEKHMTKAHEAGYHALFLPLVDFGFKRGNGKLNIAVRKTLEWIARHRTKDLRAEMRGTKRDLNGRAVRFILEPLCYAVGKLKGY